MTAAIYLPHEATCDECGFSTRDVHLLANHSCDMMRTREAALPARIEALADEWDDQAALLDGDGACGDDSARVLAPVVKRHAAAIRAALATDPEEKP